MHLIGSYPNLNQNPNLKQHLEVVRATFYVRLKSTVQVLNMAALLENMYKV